MEKKWMIKAALRSGMGRVRHNNEDAYYFNGSFHSLDSMDIEAKEKTYVPLEGSLFAVCDGIGGQNNGELASYNAVSRMNDLQNQLRGRDFNTVIQNWVNGTSISVRQASSEGGCTLALLYFQANALRIAHIGDSRIYRFHEGILTQLTQDHSKVQMLVSAGVLSPQEAKTHPQRHVITRYLGMNSDMVACEATIGRPLPLINGEKYIICSDGVSDMLDDIEIQDYVEKTPDIEQCAETIYQAALNAGGRDNTTIILMEIEGDTASKPLPLAADEDEEPTIDDDITATGKQTHVIDMNIKSGFSTGATSELKDLSISIRVSC